MNLHPYDAICFASYGGPNGPEEVLPFMRNATRGRGVPDERLAEVSKHYGLFDGVSPINQRNTELMIAVSEELATRGINVPIVIGNRNWHPFFTETLTALRNTGAKRVLCVVTAAYGSYSGCRQYREDLAGALAEVGGGIVLDKIGPFAETNGFVAANVDALQAALAELPGAHVLFVTHSIPTSMDIATGTELGSYVTQHRRVIARVLAEVGDVPHDLVFCSRSGAPHVPWLEPDINDRIEALASEGVQRVIAVPIGFVNDHMEVVYDLDTQARETAERCGLEYLRAATAGTNPRLVASLVDAIVERAAASRGECEVTSRQVCPSNCCLPRAGATPKLAID